MEELQAQGLAKSIGVSNYLPEHLDWILETCTVKPAINQIEFHPYLQHVELLKYHKEKVSISLPLPFSSATTKPLPPSPTISLIASQGIATSAYGPLTPITKGAGGPADALLAQLAKKYAVNPAEICLRYCIDQDIVPITTSGKEQRLSDYLRAMTFKLTPAEIKQVSTYVHLPRRGGERRWSGVADCGVQINEVGEKKHLRGFWTHKYDENDRR